MPRPISIVVICHNEESHIRRCIESVLPLSDDILILDSGSTDETIAIVKTYPVRLVQTTWLGYGATKNYGHSLASYGWILSIDADECVDDQLKESIASCKLHHEESYIVQRVNLIGERTIKFGHLKPEKKLRLFQKELFEWDHKAVHEQLIPKTKKIKLQQLKGSLIHRQAKDISDLKCQYEHYAHLSKKKNRNIILTRLSPLYHLLRSYIFFGGLLEGRLGLDLAKAAYFYSYKKNLHP